MSGPVEHNDGLLYPMTSVYVIQLRLLGRHWAHGWFDFEVVEEGLAEARARADVYCQETFMPGRHAFRIVHRKEQRWEKVETKHDLRDGPWYNSDPMHIDDDETS